MVSSLEVVAIAALAGCATGLGAIPTLFTERISHRTYDGALGLAAGIMFGAAVFALIVPGMDYGSVWEVLVGMLAGGLGLLAANKALPHLHLGFRGARSHGSDEPIVLQAADDWRQTVLIGGSITLHNIPEGLAIGIAFASGLEEVGVAVPVA